MSSALAIAGVTAVLRDLLYKELGRHDLSSIGSFSVTALPPDRITTGTQEPNQLNLFLYQMTPNPGWRNTGLPSYDSSGQQRLTNPPLALDLHYLLTAYGAEDYSAEILLGFAMQALHETPILSRKDIRTVLNTSPNNQSIFGNLSAEDLADQVELLKITPQYLTADELSKLWTAMQARYRQTLAYQVSVVLIQGTRPTKAALPVLQIGENDSGIKSQPDLQIPLPFFPTLTELGIRDAVQHQERPGAELGDTLILNGYHLTGDEITVYFKHPLLQNPQPQSPDQGSNATQVRLTFPPVPEKWPAGIYSVWLQIKRSGKPDAVTNALPFTLAPQIVTVPQQLQRDASGKVSISLTCNPEVLPEQRASLLLGSHEIFAEAHLQQTANLTFIVENAPITESPTPIRLRVDGVDSLLIRDYVAKPLRFDPAQLVTIQ